VKKGSFDERLGPGFLEGVPAEPGVYEWLAADGATLYVGKAKNLRRRLGQYRSASRRKATRKRWEIVRAASSVRVRTCASELDALLVETELIQRLRPRFNVASAFEFLYPCIGLRRGAAGLDLVCTTSPDAFAGFTLCGAFRSPALTRAAFASLVALLGHLGHVEPSRRVTDVPRVPYSRVVRFRQLAPSWDGELLRFLRGAGGSALEGLCLALVERASARSSAAETQRHLDLLRRFSAEESEPLRAVLARSGREGAFLPQRERDAAFLVARRAPAGTTPAATSPPA
jgi:predicted GIY-YIG superfamily endonuclease